MDESFVIKKIESLFADIIHRDGGISLPVDLDMLAKRLSVRSVEFRPMIPEGVTTPVSGGFQIYLQDNFSEDESLTLRQRFTLAHELVHTLFYDTSGELPEPLPRAPRGDRLERLCHIGAAEILMPKTLLKRAIGQLGPITSANSIFRLASKFGVSNEAVMLELQRAGLVPKEEFSAVLVDEFSGKRTIRAACWGSLIACNVAEPKRGVDFDDWIRPLVDPAVLDRNLEWQGTTHTSTIAAKKVPSSRWTFVLELVIGRRPITPNS